MQSNYQLNCPSDQNDRYRSSRRIALILSILLSGGMLVLPRIPMLILLMIFAFAATGWKGVPFSRINNIGLILMVVLFAAVIRPGPVDIASIIIRYANFLGALLLLLAYLRSGYPVLAKDLFFLMPWMAFQAILTFILANALPSIFNELTLPNEASIRTIFFVFNYHVLIEDYSGWSRPDGFFWEPGVFQLYLNLYLYLALFIFKKKNHVLLALCALSCVYSTTGLIITAILLVAAFFKYLSQGKTRQRTFVVVVAFFITPPFLFLAVNNIQDKFTGESQGSSMIRQYDLLVGLNVVSEYPLLGIGFDHNRYQKIIPNLSFAENQLGLVNTPERSTSNGILYLMYTMGIPLSLVFLWGIFKQKIFPNPWLMSMLILFSMLGEALIFTPFVLMIIFSAFIKGGINKPVVKRERLEGTTP